MRTKTYTHPENVQIVAVGTGNTSHIAFNYAVSVFETFVAAFEDFEDAVRFANERIGFRSPDYPAASSAWTKATESNDNGAEFWTWSG